MSAAYSRTAAVSRPDAFRLSEIAGRPVSGCYHVGDEGRLAGRVRMA